MSLGDSDRRLLRLFTAGVLGRFDEVVRIRQTAGAGEPDRRWREAVLQVHVFAGFPRLVEVYTVIESAGGLGAFEPDEVAEPALHSDDRERGRALFERIYRDDASLVRAMLEGHHPDFARWIEEHAYGRVLSRPGLSADRRELLAVAALAALGQDRQLASHARGALRCGATRDELDATLECVADLIEPERLAKAGRVVEKFG
jgi:alkylhydroperoxidase/carboxymuconolactone decarboxylase family protein YurZ